MRKLSFVSLCAALSICIGTHSTYAASSSSSGSTIDTYVTKYRLIAQLESFRSGIPASIILAQGILESGYGNSNLSMRSNNHFGIKWKGQKEVPYVYAFDDDYDKNGKYIPSRFIKYKSVEESFQHHTEFLMHRPNYRALFKYKSSDYEHWAYGLRACGYSTDSDYGVQLVRLIKKYKLYLFDIMDSKKVKPIAKMDDTKVVMNIFKGRIINHFTFLKTQSEAVEAANKNIAALPKIKNDSKSVLNKPIEPKNENPRKANKWVFFESLITARLWFG